MAGSEAKKVDVKRMEATRDVDGLINALGDLDDCLSPYPPWAVVEALVRIGEPAVKPLIKALEDEDGNRWYVTAALGNIGDARAVEPLIEALGDGPGFGTSAASALGAIGDKRAVVPLIRHFIRLPSGKFDDLLTGAAFTAACENDSNYAVKTMFGRTVIGSLKKLPGVKAEFLRLELYDEAEDFYNFHGMLEEAASMRRKKAEMAGPKTEIHGDYVDDRDTIVKDSVVSKSSIGAGGKSKAEEIKEIKELLDSGAIDDAEFKQMKKEILGK